jgi:hypothetical protein
MTRTVSMKNFLLFRQIAEQYLQQSPSPPSLDRGTGSSGNITETLAVHVKEKQIQEISSAINTAQTLVIGDSMTKAHVSNYDIFFTEAHVMLFVVPGYEGKYWEVGNKLNTIPFVALYKPGDAVPNIKFTREHSNPTSSSPTLQSIIHTMQNKNACLLIPLPLETTNVPVHTLQMLQKGSIEAHENYLTVIKKLQRENVDTNVMEHARFLQKNPTNKFKKSAKEYFQGTMTVKNVMKRHGMSTKNTRKKASLVRVMATRFVDMIRAFMFLMVPLVILFGKDSKGKNNGTRYPTAIFFALAYYLITTLVRKTRNAFRVSPVNTKKYLESMQETSKPRTMRSLNSRYTARK